MNKEVNFDDISIMGRVIYIILAIDIYLKEKDADEDWNKLLKALWSFPEFDKCIDEYAYKVIECSPGCVLDEREDFSTFDHFSEEELYAFRDLYRGSAYVETVDYLMDQIHNILGHNLYTSVKPPEINSLDIINKTYLYIKKILGPKTPSTEPFRIYSIYERKCWGDYTLSKEVLLSHMNKQK